MELLLDTHVLLWSIRGDERARPVVDMIECADANVHVSAATLLEVAIKHSIGKLPENVAMVRLAMQTGGMLELAIDADIAAEVEVLPLHHRDPFDRMLVAQARLGGLTIVTADPLFETYDVSLAELGMR